MPGGAACYLVHVLHSSARYHTQCPCTYHTLQGTSTVRFCYEVVLVRSHIVFRSCDPSLGGLGHEYAHFCAYGYTDIPLSELSRSIEILYSDCHCNIVILCYNSKK